MLLQAGTEKGDGILSGWMDYNNFERERIDKYRKKRYNGYNTYNTCRKGAWGMPLKPSEMERVLFEDGWVLYAQKGSHRQYKHPQKKGKVTIPFHKGKEINPVTEKSIRRQAGIE